MPERLKPSDILKLQAPPTGHKIYYDAPGKKGAPYVVGLGLRVTAAGARTFIFNYRTRAGTERRYGIGSPPVWTLNKARDEAVKLKAEVDLGGDPQKERETTRRANTVREFCAIFDEEHIPKLRAKSQQTYRQMIRDKVLPALGAMKIADVTWNDIDSLHRKITRKDGTPYVANRVVSMLSTIFALAIKKQCRTNNPCTGIKRNKEDKRDRFLSEDECVRFSAALSRIPSPQVADMIRFALLTGARSRSEVCAARWDDIDLVAGTWTKKAAATKQGKLHHAPLSAPALQLLTQLDEQAPEDQVLVFPGRDGGVRSGFDYYFKRACREAGIKNFRVHDLRHTFASHLASSGVSLPLVGALLGHSSPTTTARYAHLQTDPQRRAANSVAGVLLPTGPLADVVTLSKRQHGHG